MRFIKRRFVTLLELLIALGLTALLMTVLTGFYQQVQFLDTRSEKDQQENFKIRYAENRLAKVLLNTISEYSGEKNFHFFTSWSMGGFLGNESPSLIFIYNNGPSMDVKVANIALGMIFVDKENRLCIASWSAPSRWKKHPPETGKTEVLLDYVEGISFQFYVPPDRKRDLIAQKAPETEPNQSPQTPEPQPQGRPRTNERATGMSGAGAEVDQNQNEEPAQDQGSRVQDPDRWKSEWSGEEKQLPPLMKMIVMRKLPGADKAVKITYGFALPDSKQLIVYEQ